MHAGVAQLVPGLARHVDVEVPRHLRVLVRVAGHQLGRAQLGVHQAVEEVALLLGLGGHVVLVAVDVELVGEIGVAVGVTLHEGVARRLVERRQHAAARASRAGGSAARRGPANGTLAARARAELGEVALLAVEQLAQQPQRGLVGDRVERVEMDADGVDQRGLELAVGQLRRTRRASPRRRGGRAARRARRPAPRVVLGCAQLVEAAADLGHRARVVVEVVAERVLALEARLERQPAAAQVHELAQHVEVVGKRIALSSTS